MDESGVGISRQQTPGCAGRWGQVAMLGLALASPAVGAFEFNTGNPDVKMSWDNTLKYSAAWRVKDRDARVEGSAFNPNVDDGDRNFDKGLISNRVDLLSEFDLVYKSKLGFRVSGAGWYDEVYNRSNDNDSPATFNPVSVRHDKFPDATRHLHGRNAEFLDAFVYGRLTPGGATLNLRAGRFTQVYGESLFFGGNGIAAAQTSPDIVKLLSVPSSQFKEILRPVGQISAQLQVSPRLSFGAYYQYEWRKARLPGVGSYFSFADFVDAGGQRLFTPLGPLPRAEDLDARDSGQGGLQIRYKYGDVEYGFYAARFHDKFPQFYVRPLSGDYAVVYAQDIKVYGASLSTVVGETNVAAEVSMRRDAPLAAVGNVVVALDPRADGRDHPLYPVGNTFHAQVSAISVLPASALWEGASFLGELAFNRRLSVDKNAGQLDPNTTRDASALRFIFQPEYFQVVPGVDLQVPIGVGYGLSGRTSVLGTGFSAERGGDVSIGVKADYQKAWQASLTYTHFYGRAGAIVDESARLSFDQFHKDRDFVALSVQRTF